MNVIATQRFTEKGEIPHLRYARAAGYDLYLDRRHPAWIAELERRFDVIWSSMWQRHSADPFGVVAGFGTSWDHIPFDRINRNPLDNDPYEGRTSSRVAAIKMSGIVKTVGDRPAAVVDDDFGHHERAWAEARTQSGIATLVVVPDYEFGLQREHVDLLRAFAVKLRKGRSSNPS